MLRWHLHIYKWWKWQKGSREEHFLSLFWTLVSSLYPSSLLNIAGVGVSFKCEHWKHLWAKCWLLAKCNGRASVTVLHCYSVTITVNFTRQAFLGIAVSSYHQILLYLQFPFSSAEFFHASITHTAGLTFPQKNGRLRYIGLMAEAARVECDFDPIWFSFEQLFGNICLL